MLRFAIVDVAAAVDVTSSLCRVIERDWRRRAVGSAMVGLGLLRYGAIGSVIIFCVEILGQISLYKTICMASSLETRK